MPDSASWVSATRSSGCTPPEQLATLLLFRWDPEQVAPLYPVSEDDYSSIAHSIVIGLHVGDDRERFGHRLSNLRSIPSGTRSDPREHDRVWELVQGWLPRSLGHWWPEHLKCSESALPHELILLNEDDVASRMSRDDWMKSSLQIAELAIAEGLTESTLRRDLDFVADRPVPEVLQDVREALVGNADAGWLWSTREVDLVLRVCQDQDLHVKSALPLTQSRARAEQMMLLRH